MHADANEPSPESPAGPYTLAPVPSRHVEESRRLILAAVQSLPTEAAVVLGAGNCQEIPLAELAAHFERVTLNDVDAKLLEQAVAAAGLDEPTRAKLDIQVADLTGVTETLIEKFDTALADVADSKQAIEEMARLVDEQEVAAMPIEGRYNLVVASCVLSQLHFALLHRAGERFESRFPDQVEMLRTSSRWTTALSGMARRMENRFIDGLTGLVAPGGLIYLSESPQMCYVKLTAEGSWQTEGTFRMLRTADITDYADRRFAIVAHGRWHWVVAAPEETGQVGRLFDVQALVLRVWRR